MGGVAWGCASNFQVSDHSYPNIWSSDPNLTLTLAKILNMIITLNLSYKPKTYPTLTLILTLNLSTCVQFNLQAAKQHNYPAGACEWAACFKGKMFILMLFLSNGPLIENWQEQWSRPWNALWNLLQNVQEHIPLPYRLCCVAAYFLTYS